MKAEKCSLEYFSAIVSVANTLAAQVTPAGYQIVRRHWFGSYFGDDDYFLNLADRLRLQGTDAHLFKRHGDQEKEVDIALTKEMLINAFNDNYDLAVLVAGDEDYSGLVDDLKRFGVRIHGAFVDSGLSQKLVRSCDAFNIEKEWSSYPWGDTKKHIERILAMEKSRRDSG